MVSETKSVAGPAIHAVHPWVRGNNESSVRDQLLSDDERAQLAKIAIIVRFNKGELIYQEDDEADAAFNIISGVVTATA
jgi:CRP-like cAMP-binding protein